MQGLGPFPFRPPIRPRASRGETDGAPAYVFHMSTAQVSALNIDEHDNVSDTGIRVTGVGTAPAYFGVDQIAVAGGGANVLVHSNTLVTIIDTSTNTITGDIPLQAAFRLAELRLSTSREPLRVVHRPLCQDQPPAGHETYRPSSTMVCPRLRGRSKSLPRGRSVGCHPAGYRGLMPLASVRYRGAR